MSDDLFNPLVAQCQSPNAAQGERTSVRLSEGKLNMLAHGARDQEHPGEDH
jgi:hypothetical protein